MVTLGDAALKERIDSERNQGRAPDMDWLDHDRLGFNYRLSEIACAIGLAQLERLDGMLAARARVAGAYREALAGDRGPRAARAPTRAATCAAGSSTPWRCRAASTATRRSAALRERGVQSKPYLPAIHLMSYYRETFGHRPGEFPVCEDVAARSLALPFFPSSARARSSASPSARRGARRAHRLAADVALLRAPAPGLPGDQRLARLRPAAVAPRRRAVARARRDARLDRRDRRAGARRAARRARRGRRRAARGHLRVRARR